jgi:hypothetical protein
MSILCVCCELVDDAVVVVGGFTASHLREGMPALGDVIAELRPCLRVA